MTYNQQVSLLIEASADCTEPDLTLEGGWLSRVISPVMKLESKACAQNTVTAEAKL